jgi:hypothetical protein
VVSLPIGKAHISYSMEVEENKKKEIGKIVKKIGLNDLEELKNAIESLSWVSSVRLSRNILSRLKILVTPRIPAVRIADTEGKVIDKKGFIFDSDKVRYLPVIELSKGLSSEEIEQAIGIFDILTEFNIERLYINDRGVRTKCSNFEVVWGNDEFVRKYEILRLILKNNINEFKGKLDFRFENMVVLRR